jgi:AraC-like DNA-binding protein/CheY-like chemotaxis protein
MAIGDENAARFALISDAHHFLLAAPWLRHQECAAALARFVAAAATHTLSATSLDCIVLRVLRVLNRHTGGRLPTLVERYLDLTHDLFDPLVAFRQCVEEALRYSDVREPHVQRAMAIVEESHADATLTLVAIAKRVGVRPARLCRLFKAQTGVRVMEYLRDVRLDQAAVRLITTAGSVKEVWTAVGYNHASNFDHDFGKRFGMSPQEFRTRGIQPLMPFALKGGRAPAPEPHRAAPPRGARVLVIEDDDSMRETYAKYLGLKGYTVSTAATAEDGLRATARMAPDVVLLDYRLPDRDGLDCLRRLRQQSLPQQPAVVLFTADWTLEDHVAEVRALGATIHSKLCDLDEIESFLRALCTRTGER